MFAVYNYCTDYSNTHDLHSSGQDGISLANTLTLVLSLWIGKGVALRKAIRARNIEIGPSIAKQVFHLER